jgi:hypothetical protein
MEVRGPNYVTVLCSRPLSAEHEAVAEKLRTASLAYRRSDARGAQVLRESVEGLEPLAHVDPKPLEELCRVPMRIRHCTVHRRRRCCSTSMRMGRGSIRTLRTGEILATWDGTNDIPHACYLPSADTDPNAFCPSDTRDVLWRDGRGWLIHARRGDDGSVVVVEQYPPGRLSW